MVTYDELARGIAEGARTLDERLPEGSRVLIAAYDQMVVGLAFLAALRSHCTPLLVDPQSSAGLARVAERWGVSGFLGDRTLLDDGRPALDANTILEWTESKAEPGALPEVAPEEPAFWTFTSGTTGEPRAVVHAHRGPRAAFEAFGRGILGLESGDRTSATAGLPFVYALGNNLLFPLFAGASCILPRDLLLPTVLGEIRRGRATVLVAGPWSLEAMVRLADRARRGDALRDLRLVLSAGEPLPESVFVRWEETFGGRPIDNLGCTEMFNSFLSAPPERARAGSLGWVVPGFEVQVDGKDPTPGRRGALAVRGNSRAIALSADEATDRVERPSEPWCQTGDEVEVSADGAFVFLGRLDDRFKVRGQFVRPAEVERSLLGVEGIAEALVGPGTDEHGLACVNVRIVVGDGHGVDDVRRRAAACVREALPAAARAITVEPVETLPRSPRGKVLRERRAAIG